MIQFMQSRIRILNFEVLKKFKVSNAVWYCQSLTSTA